MAEQENKSRQDIDQERQKLEKEKGKGNMTVEEAGHLGGEVRGEEIHKAAEYFHEHPDQRPKTDTTDRQTDRQRENREGENWKNR